MVAVSQGYLVPGPGFAGTVHSVFATACNLVVDGLLLTVHDAAAPHTPTSVRVTGWRPEARAGEPVRCSAGILSFGPHVLDLRAVPVWTPPPPPTPPLSLSPTPVRARSVITGAEQVAELRERHVLARGIGVPGLDVRAERLLEALTDRPYEVPGAVARLVGFGPGLTPSGDDLLVGTLAVLSRIGRPAARAFHTLADGVRVHAHRTTDVGAHYLRLAAEGHFSEPIIGLVDALVSGAGLPARTKAALRVGASSGADGVAGVLLGLRVLGFSPDRKAA
ncbi:DUF2877 domain-containing protein [Nonomuraea candida]|uniref:DUF2877 domain-containing protein n=1 Tax=Nonomuraea candida TaxID=359159 RepID=UPI0005B8AAB3|nr:DUF2877 domain-containing protein [Nonomuraea candida]